MMTFVILAVLTGWMPQAPPAATPTPAPAATPAPADSYTYNPEGRRDPFVSLLRGGSDQRAARIGVAGLAGLTVDEISVRGVVAGNSGYVAMVMGPDNKTYIVHPGDKLLDGAIKSITPQGLVIEQAVNDPLSVVKQREVRKLLRGIEDAK